MRHDPTAPAPTAGDDAAGSDPGAPSPSADRAGQAYWERTWRAAPPPRPLRQRPWSVLHCFDGRFRRLFRQLGLGPGSRAIEVGCARSPWLPHLAQRYGFAVAGLDYSAAGCAAASALLAREGVAGEIIHADLFAPPRRLAGAFDLALSLGVVEHHGDTAAAVAAVSRLIRPGGVIVTTVPNFCGWMGPAQRWLSRPVYDRHVPLDAPALARAHRAAGLELLASEYLLHLDTAVLSVDGGPPGPGRRLLQLGLAVGSCVSAGSWLIERVLPLPSCRALAPFVLCVARRPR